MPPACRPKSGLAQQVQALDDVGFNTFRHFRMLVILVHDGDVVVDVFLFLEHAAKAVLHDHGNLEGEGRVVTDAVGDQAGEDQ